MLTDAQHSGTYPEKIAITAITLQNVFIIYTILG